MSNNLNQPLHSEGEIIQDSPLDALRKGNLEQAWSLADLFDSKRCVLWYLLLAWELKDKDRFSEAGATLKRWQEKELPQLSRMEPSLLAYVFDLSEKAFTALHQMPLSDYHRSALCRYLVVEKRFTRALKMAGLIDDSGVRAQVRQEIAQAQVQAGDIAAALETVQLINDEPYRARVLEAIATAQVKAGDIATALETAQLIHQGYRTGALEAIATAQAQAGDIAAALETAQLINDKSYRAEALKAIATAQAQAGDIAAALETAQLINDKRNQAWALEAIAKAQAQAGDIASAVQTARLIDIDDDGLLFQVLGSITSALTRAEYKIARSTFTALLEMTQRINYHKYQNMFLLEIASAMANAGDIASAMETAQLIDYRMLLSWELKSIAIETAQAGEFLKALRMTGLINDEREWIEALRAIVEIQVKPGQAYAYAARSTLSNALQMTRPLDNEATRAWTLVEILSAPPVSSVERVDSFTFSAFGMVD